jgi:alkanesulfonate monooxygenase SsuD/methylene tetrahydromethanopterin reductase-like flavin-dependent oxidoreductase (luciferase family)
MTEPRLDPIDSGLGALRFAVGVPNLREYADPRLIAALAGEAEASGWDALFVWDHLADVDPAVAATDPWIAIAAAAVRTETLRLGVMVTPLARRRPWKVARESVAMDLLCDGRFHLGVGLGGDADAEFAAFGEDPGPRARAERLDEGLEIVCALWSGEPVAFAGEHYTVRAQFTPVPVQRPRIPIWVGGAWPNRRPFRRAARFDGVFPTRVGLGHTEMMDPQELAEIVAYVVEHRPGGAPFDVVYEGQTGGVDLGADREKVERYRAAGLTWWVEKLGWFRGELADVRRRIRGGPSRR